MPISTHHFHTELYLWSSLLFALTHYIHSSSLFLLKILINMLCEHYYFEDEWIIPTKIAVTQIFGQLPIPVGENIKITPLFSAIHSRLMVPNLWLQKLINIRQAATTLAPDIFVVIVVCEINIWCDKLLKLWCNRLLTVTSFTICSPIRIRHYSTAVPAVVVLTIHNVLIYN